MRGLRAKVRFRRKAFPVKRGTRHAECSKHGMLLSAPDPIPDSISPTSAEALTIYADAFPAKERRPLRAGMQRLNRIKRFSTCEMEPSRTWFPMVSHGKKVLRFLTTLSLALIVGGSLTTATARRASSSSTPVTEVYGHASDGTTLHWVVYQPAGNGPWPAVLVIHGGGFDSGTPGTNPESVVCAEDLANAGFLALSIEYRLAPPGRLPGQTSSGRFPDQPDDVKVAVRAARADSRSNGQVGAVGGSAGGTHTAFNATTGTKGDDRIDVGVSLSGGYDFIDSSPNPNLASYSDLATNYIGTSLSDTTAAEAASPAWQVDKTASPLFLVNTLEDPMPYSQLPDMLAKLDAAGVTNYQALTLVGSQHSFDYWSTVKDPAIAFLTAGFAGEPAPTPTPTPGAADARQLLNVSTRAQIATGDNVMIGGFIVTGATPKRLLFRGLGPSLGLSGVGGTLKDPLLQLFDSNGILVESNDNFGVPTSVTSELLPLDPSESILTALLPEGSYTAVLSGVGGAGGVGLFELYDTDPASARVSNISTRGQVGTDSDVMIGGFIIGGTDPTSVIVRAIGPSLSPLGVAGALQNPFLEVHDSNGNTLFSNNDWRSDQEQAIIDTGVAPSDNRESAIVATLTPGNYTAVVSGAGGTTGVALVEVYDLESK